MQTIHVHIRVKEESIQKFIEATVENARKSIQEPGIARFDLLQHKEDPRQFLLVEVYRHQQAPSEHKATEHYLTWRDTVAEMMTESRFSVPWEPLFTRDH